MKKTFPVNINGKIFYIDEDAYRLLLDYLQQLRATFSGDEGQEIVDDIEQRISEHFDERIALGANVIVIADVNRVIEIMGRPEEISDDAPAENAQGENAATANSTTSESRPGSCPPPPPIRHRLYRDERHKVFGGVIAGLAQYLGWDATVMRILAVVLTCATYFWPCVIVYLVAWMVIPVARTPREILEMQGQPVTLDNIGQTVINNSTAPGVPVPGEAPSSFSSFINTFFSIAAKFILGFIGLFAGVTAFALCCVIFIMLAGIVSYSITGDITILNGFDFYFSEAPMLNGWGAICVMLAVTIPCLALVWAACSVLFKAKAPSKSAVITAVILEVIIISAAVVLLNLASASFLNAAVITEVDSTAFLAAIPASALMVPSFTA